MKCFLFFTFILVFNAIADGDEFNVNDSSDLNEDSITAKIDKFGQRKLKIFLQNFAIQHANLLGDYDQFMTSCKESDCEKKRISALRILNIGSEKLSKEHPVFDCDPETGLQPILNLLNQAKDLKKFVKSCFELKPGDVKFQSPTSFGASHLLKRKDDGNYQAIFNINFKYENGSARPVDMMNRVRSCLEKVSPYLKGPDGKYIEIIALTPDEMRKLPLPNYEFRPDVKEIALKESDRRADSKNFNSSIDCPTIVHEMLHQFGLCDEYEETVESMKAGLSCRVVPKTSSIMKLPLEAFEKAIPKSVSCSCDSDLCKTMMSNEGIELRTAYLNKTIFELADYQFRRTYCTYDNNSKKEITNFKNLKSVELFDSENEFVFTSPSFKLNNSILIVEEDRLVCKCPVGDNDCLKVKSELISKINSPQLRVECPSDVKELSNEIDSFSKPGAEFKNGKIVITSQPEWPSLLLPGQFNRIIESSCPEKAKEYNQCAKFAYKGPDSDGNCNIPKECFDDKFYLGVEK